MKHWGKTYAILTVVALLIVLQLTIFAQPSDVIFARTRQVQLPSAVGLAKATCLGDVDGDGDLDIVVGYMIRQWSSSDINITGQFQFRWYENTGTTAWNETLIGTFTSPVIPQPYWDAFNKSDTLSDIVVADVDNDGRRDVVFCTHVEGIRWWRQTGNNTWAGVYDIVGRNTNYNFYHNVCKIAVFDADSDGDSDVVGVFGEYENPPGPNQRGRLALYWRSGTGPSFTWNVVQIDNYSNIAFPVSLRTANVVGDSKLELFVCARAQNMVRWYVNTGGTNGTITFTPFNVGGTFTRPYDTGFSDIDRDGDLDLFVAQAGAPTVRWYINNGQANSTNFTTSNIIDNTGRQGADYGGDAYLDSAPIFAKGVDFDTDGDGDVFVSYYQTVSNSNGELVYYENVNGGASWNVYVLPTGAGGGFLADTNPMNLDLSPVHRETPNPPTAIDNYADLAVVNSGSKTLTFWNQTTYSTAPYVTALQVLGPRSIRIQFSEAMNSGDVLNPTYYQISGPFKGTLSTNPNSVTSLGGNDYRLNWTSGSMAWGVGTITITVDRNMRDSAGYRVRDPYYMDASIVDIEPPNAICKSSITKQLSTGGTVVLNATEVDDGSTDDWYPTKGMTFDIARTGSPSYTSSITFSCNDIGDIQVTLRVGDYVQYSYCNTTVTVLPPTPDANFSANVTQGQYPLNVTFTDTSNTYCSNIPITDWYWDFNGDGTWDAHYTTPTNPQWTYTSKGKYTVKLRIVTQYGEDIETKTDYIDVWPDPLAVSPIIIQEFDPPRSTPWNEDDFSNPTALNLTDGYIGFGRSFRMTVNASGGYGPPYQYQWQIFKGGSWVNVSDGSFPRNVNGSDGPNNTPVTTVISGATTNQLTVEYAIPGNEDGQYRCVVTDPNDTPPPPNVVYSNTRTITINTNMLRTILDLTTPVNKYVGESVIYGFKFIGGPGSGYLYQWYIQRGSNFDPIGSSSNPVTFFNLDQTMVGNYYGTGINVSAGGQTSFCGPSALNVQPVVSITQQPQSIHRNTGGTAVFSTTVGGGYPPYTYQWYWNDTTPLVDGPHPSGSGAVVSINNVGSTSTLTITNLGLTDAGQYKCRATDSENRGAPSTEDTQNATLTVTNPLVITDPIPSPVSVYVGSNYSVTVTASGGTTPYTFVWQRNTGSGYVTLNDGDLGGRVSIVSGASNSVFTLSNTITADTGQYRCVAVDSGPDPDAYPANAGVLNVYENLVVSTEHPADVTENVGNQAQFSVQTTGGFLPLNYEWQYATDQAGPWTPLSNGPHPLHASSIVSGADGATLGIQIAEGAHLSGLQNSYYRCIVTDSGTPQTGTSRVAKLSITNFINVQGPADVRAYTGESPVQLIVNVTGGQPPFYYEWFKGTESILGPVEGQNILDLGSADATDAGNYYVIVSDSSGGLNPDVTSRTANVKVADPPQIITQPQSLNLYAGQDAIFHVEVVGGFEPYNYDWWRVGVGSLGVNDDTLILSNVDETYDGSQYLVYVSDLPSTVTGLNTTLTSDPALLRVASSEVIFTLQPEDESLYIDDPSFWLTADFVGGLPPVYYEWKRDLPGGGTEVVAVNTLAVEVNTATLTVGTYRYYLEVTDDVPNVYQSYKARIEVGMHMSFGQDLLPEYRVASGERVEMFVQVNGGLGDKSYTWYRNVGNGKAWEVIPGAVGPVLVLEPAEVEDSGEYYVVVQDSGSSVTGQNDTITSRTATLNVEKGIPATTYTGLLVMILVASIIGTITLVRKKVRD